MRQLSEKQRISYLTGPPAQACLRRGARLSAAGMALLWPALLCLSPRALADTPQSGSETVQKQAARNNLVQIFEGQAEPAAQPLSASPASFHLEQDREPLVSLDGYWRFHPGDDPRWSDPAFDDSSWPLLRSDEPWSGQGYPNMSGIGWYRFTVVAPANHPPLAIELNAIMTSYQVFIDGKQAGQVGNFPPNIFPTADWSFHVYDLPGAANPGAQTIRIAIRVWHSPIWATYVGGGPAGGEHLFGDARLLRIQQRHHDEHRRLLFVDRFSYSIAAFIIGITIFGLYLFRPKEREYLWFAIVLMAKALDAVLTVVKELYAIPPIPVFDLLDGAVITCAQVALLFFLSTILRIRRGPLWQVMVAMAILSTPFGVLYWPGWLSVPAAAIVQIALLLPSAIWMLVILSAEALRRNPNARLLLVPVALVQGLWIADNVVITLNQYGMPVEARLIDTPFIVAPFTMHPSILAELLFLLAMLAFLIRRFTIARRREERWEGALEAARQVQNLLLPEAIPQVPGFRVDCVYRPADMVGGDFFQILPITEGGNSSLLIVVGDVAGKGLPAAMMVSMIVGAIRAEASHTTDAAQLASALNDRMTGRVGNDRAAGFTTCLCAHISSGGRLVLANAGHLPPYRNGQELPMPGALPLGMLTGVAYDLVTVQLKPGDRLTFVSDGVVEAQDKSGQLLGFDRTETLSTQSAAEIAEAASRFGQVDDITVVTIEFLGAPSHGQSADELELAAQTRAR